MCEEAASATRADIAERARSHYDEITDKAMAWTTTIPAAIDAWEREPELEAERDEARHRLKEAARWVMKRDRQWRWAEKLLAFVRANNNRYYLLYKAEEKRAASAEKMCAAQKEYIDNYDIRAEKLEDMGKCITALEDMEKQVRDAENRCEALREAMQLAVNEIMLHSALQYPPARQTLDTALEADDDDG